METKKEYMAPELTVVSFKTERGYAASNPVNQLLQTLSALAGFNAFGIQEWEEVDVPTDGGDWNWS